MINCIIERNTHNNINLDEQGFKLVDDVFEIDDDLYNELEKSYGSTLPVSFWYKKIN